MEKIKTCCVTGHRDIPEEKVDRIHSLLRREILAAIQDGYTHFISGFAFGADLLFADIVVGTKRDLSHYPRSGYSLSWTHENTGQDFSKTHSVL